MDRVDETRESASAIAEVCFDEFCLLRAECWMLSIVLSVMAVSDVLRQVAVSVLGVSKLCALHMEHWMLSILLCLAPLGSGLWRLLSSKLLKEQATSGKPDQNITCKANATGKGPASEELPVPEGRTKLPAEAPTVQPSARITQICEQAANTMILSDVLEVLDRIPEIIQLLPGCSALGHIYEEELACIRVSPDLSCTVKEALENERRRGTHEGCTPKGQMHDCSMGCRLFLTVIAFSWAVQTIEGIREGLYIGVAAAKAYHTTLEPHHGFCVRSVWKAAFLVVSKVHPDSVQRLFEGLETPVARRFCAGIEACFHEAGLFDYRKI